MSDSADQLQLELSLNSISLCINKLCHNHLHKLTRNNAVISYVINKFSRAGALLQYHWPHMDAWEIAHGGPVE